MTSPISGKDAGDGRGEVSADIAGHPSIGDQADRPERIILPCRCNQCEDLCAHVRRQRRPRLDYGLEPGVVACAGICAAFGGLGCFPR